MRTFAAPLARALFVAFAAACALSASSSGDEPLQEFLSGLQRRGYGELAVEYLRSIEKRSDLPEKLRETWDFELAECFRLAALEAPNAVISASYQAESKRYLDKFQSEHPNHPAVPQGLVRQGDVWFEQGLLQLRNTERTKNNEVRQAACERVATSFAKAMPLYDQAVAMCVTADNMPPENTSLRFVWGEARTKLALIDYWTASMTNAPSASDPDAESTKRTPRQVAFAKVANHLAKIAEDCRGESAGLVAQYWQARALVEAGDLKQASAVFDEVLNLALEPEEEDENLTEAEFFAEVLIQRLQLLRRQKLTDDLVIEASAWLKAREKHPDAPGYQAVRLELVKSLLASAELEEGSKRRAARRTAIAELSEIAKVPGNHRFEALQLLRKERQADAQKISTEQELEELLALAFEAERYLMWQEAEQHLVQALAVLDKSKETAKVAETSAEIARLQIRRARWLTAQGDWPVVLGLAEKAVEKRTDAAPAIAALGATSAVRALASSTGDERAKLHERLVRLAEQAQAQWPNRGETDDVLLALGQAEVYLGQIDSALTRFESIREASLRHRQAQYQAGKLLWRQCAIDAEKDTPAMSPEQKQRLVTRAEACLVNCLAKSDDVIATAEPRDARPLLAELCLLRGDAAAASEWLEPVVARALAANAPRFDSGLLRAMHAAIRAEVAQGRPDEARKIVLHAVQNAPDTAEFNRVLLDMLRLALKDSLTKDKPRDASSNAPQESANASDPQIDEMVKLLASRQQLGPREQLVLGDLCMARGSREQANELYRRLVDSANADPAIAQEIGAPLTRARIRVVQFLREKQDFARASAELDTLLVSHPRSLELALEKGRVLEAWSRTDLSQVDAALAQWTKIRLSLGRQSPPPPEYFEAVYNAAVCLRRQAIKTKSPAGFDQAKKLLDATLVLYPKLSGETVVARYRQLLSDLKNDLPARPSGG